MLKLRFDHWDFYAQMRGLLKNLGKGKRPGLFSTLVKGFVDLLGWLILLILLGDIHEDCPVRDADMQVSYFSGPVFHFSYRLGVNFFSQQTLVLSQVWRALWRLLVSILEE